MLPRYSQTQILFIAVNESNEQAVVSAKKCDRIVVCDPNHSEEAMMDGKLVLGINPYKEICTLHLAGQMIIDKVVNHIAEYYFIFQVMKKYQTYQTGLILF